MNKEIEQEKTQLRAINKKKAKRLIALVKIYQQGTALTKDQEKEFYLLYHELVSIAMEYEKAGKYFAHNFHIGSCLAYCCKYALVEIPPKYILLPFNYVALVVYGKDFNAGVGPETIQTCVNVLRDEIAKKGSNLRRMRGYGKINQYDPNKTLFLSLRQLDVLRLYLEDFPSAAALIALWRQNINWSSDITQIGFR